MDVTSTQAEIGSNTNEIENIGRSQAATAEEQGRLRGQRLETYICEESHDGNHLVALHNTGNASNGYCNHYIPRAAFEDGPLRHNIGTQHLSMHAGYYGVAQPNPAQQDQNISLTGAWAHGVCLGPWPSQIEHTDDLHRAENYTPVSRQPKSQQQKHGPAGFSNLSQPKRSPKKADRRHEAAEPSHRGQRR